MKIKALALCSGGLDSTLAARIIAEQGIAVEGLFCANAFLPAHHLAPRRETSQLGIKLHILDISQPHLELVRRPRYGYGEQMNPCLDCRILMLKQARAYMESQGFSFLVSGEVLGQRPMSQRKDALNIVERDARVRGLLLRPLSAKKLTPTLAEKQGWIDRDKLFDFSGRSRKPQLALARKLGIKEYATPAGGCLLTDAEFARRFRDLLQSGHFDLSDVQLLKIGRHFRYADCGKIIVGRNEQENGHLAGLAKDTDILLQMRDFNGPLTLLQPDQMESLQAGAAPRECPKSFLETAAQLTARYSKAREKEKVWVDYWPERQGKKQSILIAPAGEDFITQIRI